MQIWFLFLLCDPINSLKASKFEIGSKRQDWIEIDQVLKIWFYTKIKFWLSLNGDWFLPIMIQNPSSTYTWCIPHEKERKNCSKNPSCKLKKPCLSSKWESYFQPFSIVFEVSNRFLDISRSESDLYFAKNHQESWKPNLVCSWIFKFRFLIFMHY